MSSDRTSVPIEVSIILPCLNEAATIGVCINRARAFLDRQGVSGEIVVGDSGSSDDSVEVAQRHGARVILAPNRGYGLAIRTAMASARGKYFIMADSDDTYDLDSLGPFLEKLRAGSDLVIGNRFAGEIYPGAMPWPHKYLGNPLLSWIGRMLFDIEVQDFHCGIRSLSRRAYEQLELRSSGMEFASEMVIRARLKHLRVSEVPTTLKPSVAERRSHLRPFRDGVRHIGLMIALLWEAQNVSRD
jgi:glycosyltransferase involved in cell wall biosynthesis